MIADIFIVHPTRGEFSIAWRLYLVLVFRTWRLFAATILWRFSFFKTARAKSQVHKVKSRCEGTKSRLMALRCVNLPTCPANQTSTAPPDCVKAQCKASSPFVRSISRSFNCKFAKPWTEMSFRLKRLFRSRGSRSPSPLPTASRLTSEPSRGYSLLAAGPQDLPAQPWPPTIDPVSAATNVSAPPAPIGEGQNYGVKVLYDSGTEASVDIVFVHGLTGNAYNTWLHKDTGVHWPSELLGRDIPHARILSFGYDADIVNLWSPVSNSRLSNHAENMIGDLVRKRERTNTETRKILFVAHSLGGLVTECALNYSRNAVEKFLHQIERYTAGIIFLGVPHCGADLAAWANFGTRMVSILRRANKDIVGVLKPKSEMLRVAENDFYKILRLRKDEGSEISITCFYEELPVIGIGEV